MNGLYGGSWVAHMSKHYRNSELRYRKDGLFDMADFFRQLADLTEVWSFEELPCQIPRHWMTELLMFDNPLMRRPWDWGWVPGRPGGV